MLNAEYDLDNPNVVKFSGVRHNRWKLAVSGSDDNEFTIAFGAEENRLEVIVSEWDTKSIVFKICKNIVANFLHKLS